MIKQIVAIIALSIAVILTMSYAQQAIQLLLNLHEWISQALTDVFSGGHTGSLIRGLIALLSVPVLIGSVPAVAYWVLKRHWFPYFMEVIWVVWLIQAGALIIMYKAATV